MYPFSAPYITKEQELRRTAELLEEILDRGRTTEEGIYLMVAFLYDSQTDLKRLMPFLEERLSKSLKRLKAKTQEVDHEG